MNPFTASVMINHLKADYQIFLIGKKFKAMLVQTSLGKYIPCQLDFWKEEGVWKTWHPLTPNVIQQFGNCIENHLTMLAAQKFENPGAAKVI